MHKLLMRELKLLIKPAVCTNDLNIKASSAYAKTGFSHLSNSPSRCIS